MQNCLLEVLLLLTPTGLLTTLVYLYLNAGKPTKHHTGQLFLDVQNLMQYRDAKACGYCGYIRANFFL